MFSKFRDLLWPLGATALALFVVPIAIEQYPEIFKDAPWILPSAIVVVCVCWTIPLLVHDRVRGIHGWILTYLGRRWGWVVVVFALIVTLGSVCTLGYKLYGKHRRHLEARLEGLESRTKPTDDIPKDAFAGEFTLGYYLFKIANHEFFPFQGTNIGFLVHWEKKNYSWEANDETITLHLPDIDVQPNMLMRRTTVILPRNPGSSVTFRLDPKSFVHGAALVSNVFERIPEHATDSTAQSESRSELLPNARVVYITQATVVWGANSYYRPGQLRLMDGILWVSGGVLGTSKVNIFQDTVLIRGNKFVGGPRGGYVFPKAESVMGNEFVESIFDASRIPDGSAIADNHFISSKGVYRIGPQPEISFVVKIVKTEKDDAVLLFGAKPYSDDEGQP